MDRLSKDDILQAFQALSEELARRGIQTELNVLGGAALVLLYEARDSTRDVDAFVTDSTKQGVVREVSESIAHSLGLPLDWLNDGAKGYLQGILPGETLFATSSLTVRALAIEQLLAMKLSAWRDDVDIADARLLLSKITGSQDEVWEAIKPFLLTGRELKAQYAFEDLWESEHGTA